MVSEKMWPRIMVVLSPDTTFFKRERVWGTLEQCLGHVHLLHMVMLVIFDASVVCG